MPKKILFIGHSSDLYGGAEDDFERILKYFHSIPGGNYEIYGLFPKGEHSLIYENYCRKFGYIDKIFFPVTPQRKKDYLYFFIYSYKQIRDIHRFIKKEKFDLCVLNVSVHLIPAIYLYLKGFKMVIFIREMIFPLLIRKMIYRIYSKKASFVISVTKELEREYKEVTKNNNIVSVLSAVEENPDILKTDDELSEFINNDLQKRICSHDIFKFACIGPLTARKNQILIINAIEYLRNKDVAPLPEIYFIGNNTDDKEYVNKVEEIIKKKGLDDNFFFLGGQPKKVVYKLISLMNGIIISSFSEGLPIVVAEALKFCVPLISTRAGGITDVIEDNFNGLLAEMNPESVAEKIIKIMDDTDLRNRLIKNGYNTYKEKLNLENNLLMIRNIFDSVMKG